jgi:hypothetical protein
MSCLQMSCRPGLSCEGQLLDQNLWHARPSTCAVTLVSALGRIQEALVPTRQGRTALTRSAAQCRWIAAMRPARTRRTGLESIWAGVVGVRAQADDCGMTSARGPTCTWSSAVPLRVGSKVSHKICHERLDTSVDIVDVRGSQQPLIKMRNNRRPVGCRCYRGRDRSSRRSAPLRSAHVICPVLFGHRHAGGGQPAQVPGGGSGEITPPAKDWVGPHHPACAAQPVPRPHRPDCRRACCRAGRPSAAPRRVRSPGTPHWQPTAKPLRECDHIGDDAVTLMGENLPVRPIPVCTWSITNSAPCTG